MRYQNCCPFALALPPARPYGRSVVLPRPTNAQGDYVQTPSLVRIEERAGAYFGVALWSLREEICPALPLPVAGVTLLAEPDVAKEAALQGRRDVGYPILARYGTRCLGIAFYSPTTGTWVFAEAETEEAEHESR